MGANIGTTITGQILRMSEISGTSFLQLLKPTTLAPLAAIIGILVYMSARRTSAKQVGTVLLGFAVLFIGMFNMGGGGKALGELPHLAEVFATLSNPVLGVLAGAVITAIIQVLRFHWYFAGIVCYRRHHLRRRLSHRHGAKHRYLHYADTGQHGASRNAKRLGRGASEL